MTNQKALISELKRDYPVNAMVEGVVCHHEPFGVFIDIGHSQAKGLIQIVDFLDEGTMSTDQYPPVGAGVKAVVLGHTEDGRHQVWLSMKPSKLRSIT